MKKDSEVLMTPLDVIAGGTNLQFMKALLPYLRQESQMSLAVMIKFQEIQNLISFFRDSGSLTAQSFSDETTSMAEILSDMAPYFPPDQQEQMQQAAQMMEMLNLIQAMSDNTEQNQPDFLKTMLSPEQQSLFETYQAMFSSKGKGKEQSYGSNLDESSFAERH